MEQNDYIKKQVDQLGIVLAQLINVVIGAKKSGQISLGLDIVNKSFKNQLGINIDDLIVIPNDTFIEILSKEKKLSFESIEKIAELLTLFSEQQKDKIRFFEKSLIIYEFLEKSNSTFSVDRYWKIKRIQDELKKSN